jgi:3-oxo-5-alpha-steroid 4-dehydrogenase 3
VQSPKTTLSQIDQLLDFLQALTVPHSYFTHFYIVSLACSLFWAWARLGEGNLPTTTTVAWLLMLLQGARRTLESYTYSSNSKSRMWFGHWILGLLFYVTINAAIFLDDDSKPASPSHAPPSGNWKLWLLPPLILTCHVLQHSYHAYLYRLRIQNSTYQLPSHPLFPNLLCPHYTCETVIYLLLSLLAAPPGRSVNWTLACGTVFVVVNLGVTAAGTKVWYEERFGRQNVRGRKRMVPYIW